MTTDPREFAAAVVEFAKPRLRGWLHTVIAPLALAAGIVLVVLAPTGAAAAAAAAFGLSAVLLFTTSAIYHRGHWSERVERHLKRLDHANIFFLIAGTYTPFAVLALHDETRIALLAAVWGAALVGALTRVLWVGAPRWSSVPLYLGLGWAAGFFLPQLIHGAGAAVFTLIAVGGACYTAGALIYGFKRPDPNPRWFGFHEIFHSLTVAGFVCQYVAASLLIYRAA